MNKIEPSVLWEKYSFNPLTGKLYHRKKVSNRTDLNKPVGSTSRLGYLCCAIGNTPYKVHRLVYAWVYGENPDDEINHKNRVRDDNHHWNLEVCNRSHNMSNTSHQEKHGGVQHRMIDGKSYRTELGKRIHAERERNKRRAR